jgi:hypothetical protein
MKSFIRTIVILAIVGGLGYYGYTKYFAGQTAAPTSALETTPSSTNSGLSNTGSASGRSSSAVPVGQDFLSVLLSVQSIKLDVSLFSSKAFAILQDFNRPIPPDQDPGRRNPFAPIGVDGGTVAGQVATSAPSSVTTVKSTLNGTLTVSDPTAMRWFEYGTTPALGTMTTPKPQPTAGAFAEVVDKLLPNTTYYVKASATVQGVPVSGAVVTWKTAQGGTQPKR